MIIPDQEQIKFDSAEVTTLRYFFSETLGKKFLQAVAALAPEPTEEGGGEKIIHRAGKVAGYNEALKNAVTLIFQPIATEVKSDPVSTNFPDLDNESAWEGDKPKHE